MLELEEVRNKVWSQLRILSRESPSLPPFLLPHPFHPKKHQVIQAGRLEAASKEMPWVTCCANGETRLQVEIKLIDWQWPPGGLW